jgi:hypothetical protein
MKGPDRGDRAYVQPDEDRDADAWDAPPEIPASAGFRDEWRWPMTSAVGMGGPARKRRGDAGGEIANRRCDVQQHPLCEPRPERSVVGT